MTPADIFFRIALLVMCAFSLLAVASLVWMSARSRFPLLGLHRPKPVKPPAGQGGKPTQVSIVKPVIDTPKAGPPEQVRMVGENVAIGQNPRSRIVLKEQ